MKRYPRMMFSAAITLAGTMILASTAWAEDSSDVKWDRIWKCGDLTLKKAGDWGRVVFDGIEIVAIYYVQGLSHRWDWSDETDGSNYSVIVEKHYGESTASYYDFTNVDKGESTLPNMSVNCDSAK